MPFKYKIGDAVLIIKEGYIYSMWNEMKIKYDIPIELVPHLDYPEFKNFVYYIQNGFIHPYGKYVYYIASKEGCKLLIGETGLYRNILMFSGNVEISES